MIRDKEFLDSFWEEMCKRLADNNQVEALRIISDFAAEVSTLCEKKLSEMRVN